MTANFSGPGSFAAEIVVKHMEYIHAVIIFLMLANVAVAGDRYECSYHQNGVQDILTEQNCLTYLKNVRNKVTGGDALVSKKVTLSAAYDENGLAYLYSPAGVFYFTRAGLARKTLLYDNGADYFREGLARTEWGGKIGFIDKKLSIAIAPKYDFAFSFENGLAVVCNGCSREISDEHTMVNGGRWGAIDKKGEIVYPVIYSKNELESLLKHSVNK